MAEVSERQPRGLIGSAGIAPPYAGTRPAIPRGMRTAALFLVLMGCDTSGELEPVVELEGASYYSCVSQQDEVYNGTMTVYWNGAEPEIATFLYGILNTLDEERIAEVRKHCGLPIPGFIVTADHSSQVQEATKRAGYELLQKPIKPAQLRSLMGHALA